MQTEQLIENDTLVSVLSKAIHWGGANLRDVPPLIKRLLREDRWQHRVIQQTGEVVDFERFVDFVTTPPLEGLGADLKLIKRMCEGDTEALDLIDQVTGNRQGERTDIAEHNIVDNINEVDSRPNGTSKEYAIRKLRKDRPDLHARVLASELTPHAAMLEAGFRQKTVTIPLDPRKAAQTIKRAFTPDQINALIEALTHSEA